MVEQMRDGTNKKQKKDVLQVSLYENMCQMFHPAPEATGLRTQAFRYQTLEQSNDARLAEAFLINSRLLRQDRELELSVQNYFTETTMTMLALQGQGSKSGLLNLPLPEGTPLSAPLGDVVQRRRSQRTFTGEPMTLADLAALVRCAAGVTAEQQVTSLQETSHTYRLRACPSGGGLYPIDLYCAALAVQGLERGCYLYRPVSDTLTQVGKQDMPEHLLHCFAIPDTELLTMSRASALFLIAGHPWRSMRKYGTRGMRFLFHEAGAMSEQIHLSAGALGLGSFDCASLYDDEVHEVMGWDGLFQTLIHCLIVGQSKTS